MWEDEKNKRGGRWLITLNKQQRRSDLDRFWLETVSTSGSWGVLCLCENTFNWFLILVCYSNFLAAECPVGFY